MKALIAILSTVFHTRTSRELNPGLDFVLPERGKMFLVGTLEAEDRFLEIFHPAGARARKGNR